jgi:hypothetical protein
MLSSFNGITPLFRHTTSPDLNKIKVGTPFILNFSAIVNKPTADIYLICKKYFKKSQLDRKSVV